MEQEKEYEELYNKRSEYWDYYSGLPSVLCYETDNSETNTE